MSPRRRNLAAQPWLNKLEAEGKARATRKAQERVAGAVQLQTKAGVTPFDAAANAIAAETGRPLPQVKAWLLQQVERQKVINALAAPKKPTRWETFVAFLSGLLK